MQLRAPSAGLFLAQSWVRNSFRRLAERRLWSWLVKRNQIIFPAVYTTGTVQVTQNSTTVVGTNTVWDATMQQLQFRVGMGTPVYTIATVTDATHLELDLAWGPASNSGLSYSIYRMYYTPPSDFLSFISVWDTQQAYQLKRNVSQADLNQWDPQRANIGQPYVVAALDYNSTDVNTPPLPRYEIWPGMQSAYVLSHLYISRATDISDSDGYLPRYIRGDVILEMALAECARWPGPDLQNPNPYFSLGIAEMHDGRADRMIMELERQDNEIYEANVQYYTSMPYAPFMDSTWQQSHDIF